MKAAIVLLNGMRGFDVTALLEVFAEDRTHDGVPANEVLLASPHPHVTLEHGLTIRTRPLTNAADADLLIVPGFSRIEEALDSFGTAPAIEVARLLNAAHASGAELASVCTGVFLLAHCGVLDGTTATTHWRYCSMLADCYPALRVDPNVLYTHDDGRKVWTSAGVTAGIDLCLAILSQRIGAAATAAVARSMVLPAARRGGQAQFVPPRQRGPQSVGSTLEEVCSRVRHDLARPWTLADLARAARMSPRTVQRRFGEERGVTPSQWIIGERITAACELLEDSDLTIEQIACRVGFASSDLLRKHFAGRLTISPSRYREAFARSRMTMQ